MSTAIISIGNFGGSTSAARISPTRSSSHLRITARGRAVLVAIVATPLVAAALFIGINAGGATATSDSTPLSTITVTPGETLWQVAEKVAPSADPRDVIADIMQVNRMDSAAIGAGEQLKIPAQYTSAQSGK